MVTLFYDAKDFGFHSFPHVKAHYNTLEEAMMQAEHNLKTNAQRPVKIEDEQGAILWEAPQ